MREDNPLPVPSSNGAHVEDQSPELLTVTQVAKRLNVHPNTVRRWVEQCHIKAYRIGPRRDRRFRPEDVDRFLLSDFDTDGV